MSPDALSFTHIYQAAAAPSPPILLLHGIGGNEHDLIPLARTVAPGSAVLAPRGNHIENGLPRFFRGSVRGSLDEEDLHARAVELVSFIIAAQHEYKLRRPVIMGYSQGSVIGAAALMLRPRAFVGAILVRASLPFNVVKARQMRGAPVLIISGSRDPIFPLDSAKRLCLHLQSAGATVRHEVINASHSMTEQDALLIADFFVRLKTRPFG